MQRRCDRIADAHESGLVSHPGCPAQVDGVHLYSREYFALLRRRLKPGGLAVTWAPTERVRRTFVNVFPYVLGLDEIYIGSDAPIPFEPSIVAERATKVRSYYAAAGIGIEALIRPYLEISCTVTVS